MKILWKKTIATEDNGTFDIQIEDWSEDYPNIHAYGDVLATYPVSKASVDRPFGPRLGHIFRCALSFGGNAEAKLAAYFLEMGISQLAEFANELENPSYYRCLTGN